MADRSSKLRARLLATFRAEARDHIRAIAVDLAAIENERGDGDVSGYIESLFRNMHTLKGAARSVGLKQIESLCQDCESTLSGIVQGRTALTLETLNALRSASEGITRLVEGEAEEAAADAANAAVATDSPAEGDGSAAGDTAAVTPESSPEAGSTQGSVVLDTRELIARLSDGDEEENRAEAHSETIRVEVDRIDDLVMHAENLLAPRLSLGESIGDVKRMMRRLDVLKRRLGSFGGSRGDLPSSVVDTLTEAMADIDSLTRTGGDLLRDLDQDHAVMRESVDELFTNLRNVRMMPVSLVLEPFPLMVRDLVEELGKKVVWQSDAGDLVIDRKVMEFIKDPLIHMVRNAIDHGIEPPDVREAAGKPAEGRVSLTFSRPDSGRIAIRVADDGRGIDADNVRQAAVRLRLADQERAKAMTDAEVRDLIFRSGLSTSPVITTLSGHGLGLSVVRERVERLGGDIDIESESGRGTAITLSVPESIARFTGLLVSVSGGHSFLMPTNVVVQVIRIEGAAAAASTGTRFVQWDNRTIPFAFLADVLGIPRKTRAGDSDKVTCVIVSHGNLWGAFAVDSVEGEREVLVKEFQWPIVRAPNVAAIGLLGTGAQTFILRPLDLLRAAAHARPLEQTAIGEDRRRKRLRVLVVDDSITTRTMERQLFESSGFLVKVAVDGSDAWNQLDNEDIDLVVSDIDMPRMNGFELTERIRASAAHRDLPIILVTALESRDDKEKGLRLGANAYVQKSTFDQSNLLEIVRRLV